MKKVIFSKLNPLQLSAHCQRKQVDRSHEPYCMEQFRRAICDHNSASWDQIHRDYYGLVRHWVHQCEVPDDMPYEDLTQDAFAAFWKAYNIEKFERAKRLGEILSYLRLCTHTVVAQAQRAQKREVLASEWDERRDEFHPDSAPSTDALLQRQQVWRMVLAICNNEQEQLLARATFINDMKPREIAHEYPEQFVDVAAVNRIKRNVLLRLRRNPDLLAMYEK